METLLEKHVANYREISLKMDLASFEARYPALLPLLRASDVSYLLEQEAGANASRRYLLFFRWAQGYLYSCRWLLLPDGSLESQGQPAGPELVTELLAEQVRNWDKWGASVAWKKERLFWLACQFIQGVASLLAIGLFLMNPCGFTASILALSIVPWLIISFGLRIDRNRRFPQGWTPKPDHILRHTKLRQQGGPVIYSSAIGQYNSRG